MDNSAKFLNPEIIVALDKVRRIKKRKAEKKKNKENRLAKAKEERRAKKKRRKAKLVFVPQNGQPGHHRRQHKA